MDGSLKRRFMRRLNRSDKIIIAIILWAILAVYGVALGLSFKPQIFPFIGRWQPGEKPLLIDDYGYQDVQNLRKDGKRLRGVKGHTAINSATYTLTTDQNYTEYTNVGTSFLVIAADSISVTPTAITTTDTVYSYTEFSSGYFGSNFEHYFNVSENSIMEDDAEAVVWGVSNGISGGGALGQESIALLATSFVSGGYTFLKFQFEERTKTDAYLSGTYLAANFGSDKYLGIKRTRGLAGNGKIELLFFTTSDKVVSSPTSPIEHNLNSRVDYKRLYGFSNSSEIGSGAWGGSVSDLKIKHDLDSAYHFKKDSPTKESHVIVQTSDMIYQNTTAIPDTGDFTPTALHENATSYNLGRFSDAPQGYLLYANGVEAEIYGGDESYPIRFLATNTNPGYTVTDAFDYSEEVTNSLQTAGNVATVGETNNSNTVLLMHMDGDNGSVVIPDTSTGGAHGNAFTANSAALDTEQIKFGSSSLRLTRASNDYIWYADSDDWYFNADFTVELWFRLASGALGQLRSIIGQIDVEENNYWGIHLNADNTVSFTGIDTGVQYPAIGLQTTTAIVSGQWYHVAVSRQANSWYLFLNGALEASTTEAKTVDNLASTLNIGQNFPAAGWWAWDGWIDEVRITKGKAVYASAFAAPDSAYVDRAYWLVGAPCTIDGVKYYLSTTNAESASLTAWEWSGTDWSVLDITADGTQGLSVNEQSVTWRTTEGSSEARYLEGDALYWYKFQISAGQADIYQVTVSAPMQPIPNIWDGAATVVAGFRLYSETIQDFSDAVNDDTTTYVAVLDLLPTDGYMLLGFTEPMQGVNIRMAPGKENTNAAVMTPYMWTGTAWQALYAVADGTSYSGDGGISLSSTGAIVWQLSTPGTETENKIDESPPLYWYKFVWSAELDSDVEIYYVTGIPGPGPIDHSQTFPALYQNRAFLFKDNRAMYSGYNAPYIWNGADAGVIYFGVNTDLTAAAVIYNVFRTTGYEQLIVTKQNETWRMFGDYPGNWELSQMSGNVGCVAPLSMAVCEIADISTDTKRHVAIWQTNTGVVMCDGATIIPISDDIRNYWDSTDSDYIPTDRQDDSVGWYDSNLQSYKLLISSGSGQTTHNVELEYSLKYQEWTKLYRENASGANPLQVGIQVHDTDGAAYSYGFPNDGYMYRLENGKTWAGTAIAESVWTKDILIDTELPFFRKSIVEWYRLIMTAKAGGEDITIAHYCDGTITVNGVNDQSVPTAASMANSYSDADCWLGPCLYHSFKFSADVSAVDDGMELQGFGMMGAVLDARDY